MRYINLLTYLLTNTFDGW